MFSWIYNLEWIYFFKTGNKLPGTHKQTNASPKKNPVSGTKVFVNDQVLLTQSNVSQYTTFSASTFLDFMEFCFQIGFWRTFISLPQILAYYLLNRLLPVVSSLSIYNTNLTSLRTWNFLFLLLMPSRFFVAYILPIATTNNHCDCHSLSYLINLFFTSTHKHTHFGSIFFFRILISHPRQFPVIC